MHLQKNIVKILNLEALVFFIAALWIYYLMGASWWIFAAFILIPDFFMVGYLKDSNLGAIIYNAGHTYIAPFLLLGLYMIIVNPVLLSISVIWIAHISMDRMLGYGLKHSTGFKHTHLGDIGKNNTA